MSKLKVLLKGTIFAIFSGILQAAIVLAVLTVWPYHYGGVGYAMFALITYPPAGFLVGVITGAFISKAHLSQQSDTHQIDGRRKRSPRKWLIIYICLSVACAIAAFVNLSRQSDYSGANFWSKVLFWDVVIAASVAFYIGYWRLIQFMESRRIFERVTSPAIRSPQRKAAIVMSIIVAGVLWFIFADSMLPKRLQIHYLFGRRDFSGEILYDVNLSGLNLSGANFTGANLGNSNLKGISLSGADLRDADLVKTDLADADLSGANLMGVELDRSDLTGADLRGANFETAQMSRNDLHGTLVDSQTTWPDPKWELCWSIVNLGAESRDLMGSDLSWTYLDKTNLREANLHGANLTGAHFGFADMRGVDLSEANLDSASLDKADLTGADLSGANLNAATLFYTDLTGADLTGTILTHVILNGTNLEKAEYDRYTVWPPTLDPDQLGAIRVD